MRCTERSGAYLTIVQYIYKKKKVVYITTDRRTDLQQKGINLVRSIALFCCRYMHIYAEGDNIKLLCLLQCVFIYKTIVVGSLSKWLCEN